MITPKSKEEIEIMRQGGRKLSQVKDVLRSMIKPGATGIDLERQANEEILRLGGKPSFKMVKGYHWATCININEGIVHGIPNDIVFRQGDLIKVDVGLFLKGFHTDSAFSVSLGNVDRQTKKFLSTGQKTLLKAVKKAAAGNKISDISKTIEESLKKQGHSPTRELTGHGVGRKLHEEPMIPCLWDGTQKDELICEGATLAIEVIYTYGSPKLVLGDDGWTIKTKDGKIAGLFEETIAVINGKPEVLTA